jgi:bilin biosynthesis protein
MTNRFANLFGLDEAQSIALLDTPLDQLAEDDSRYVAAAQLANFPSESAISALIRAVQVTDESLENRIVRRKAVESLGRLQAQVALPVIADCLADADPYLVENAAWAIGEIGTHDAAILDLLMQVLDRPEQTYRVVIHTLAKLHYTPALEAILPFVEASDGPTASAAASAVCRLSGDYSLIDKVLAYLHDANVYARRLCIQDLIDAQYYPAIPQIARCPVSLVFRMRGIRLLGDAGQAAGKLTFAEVQPAFEQVLYDHPQNLELVHAYDQPPTLAFLIRELYETDFGRCYLATQTILESHADTAGAALLAAYDAEAREDYGAHYHVMKLWGWLRYQPAYDRLVAALHNPEPQYLKSRGGAALALGELGDARAIAELQANLDSKFPDLRYAVLLALEKLGDPSGNIALAHDSDWFVRSRATLSNP